MDPILAGTNPVATDMVAAAVDEIEVRGAWNTIRPFWAAREI